MKKILLFILLITIQFSFAEEGAIEVKGTPNQIFRPFSRKHVDMLIERGILKIGKLDLTHLSDELNTVEWAYFDLGFLLGSGGKRISSVYFIEKKQVVINWYSFKNMEGNPVPMFSWALHEGLGALGYQDENYEISGAISFMANHPELEKDLLKKYAPLFKAFDRENKERLYLLAGGATVVGGGGDAAIIELKQQMLNYFFTMIKTSSYEDYSKREIDRALIKLNNLNVEFGSAETRSISEDNIEKYKIIKKSLIINSIYRSELKELYSASFIEELMSTLHDHLF
jgi:hypothetical protein